MATLEPLPRWSRWVGLGLLVAVAGLVVWSAWPKWSPAEIVEVLVDGSRLEISTDSCGARDVDAAVEEGADAVTITLHVYDEPRHQDCVGEVATVVLDRPLGERVLVDGTTGRPLRCEPPGATRQDCVR